MSRSSGGRTYAGQAIEDRQKERRSRFLESGLTVFARDGYANSSVGTICREAGLSSRQFYEEFNGREALLIELVDVINTEAREAVLAAAAANAEGGIRRVVEEGLRGYIKSIGTDARRARVALVEAVGASPRVEEHRALERARWTDQMAVLAEAAATAGEIPGGDFELRIIAIIGAVNYAVYEWAIAEARPDLDHVTSVLTRVLIGAALA